MHQSHKKAFLTHFEMALEWAILIIASDLVWLVHDIIVNGIKIWYVVVGLGLSTGLIGTIYVLTKHHKEYVHRLMTTNKKVR